MALCFTPLCSRYASLFTPVCWRLAFLTWVQPDNKFNSADNGIGMNYTLTEPNLLPFYEHVRSATKLRVLVYNGDTDPGINSMVTQVGGHVEGGSRRHCVSGVPAWPRPRVRLCRLRHLNRRSGWIAASVNDVLRCDGKAPRRLAVLCGSVAL